MEWCLCWVISTHLADAFIQSNSIVTLSIHFVNEHGSFGIWTRNLPSGRQTPWPRDYPATLIRTLLKKARCGRAVSASYILAPVVVVVVCTKLSNHICYDNLSVLLLLGYRVSASFTYHRRPVSGVSDRSVVSFTVKKVHNKLPIPSEKQLYLRCLRAWLDLKCAFPLPSEAACSNSSWCHSSKMKQGKFYPTEIFVNIIMINSIMITSRSSVVVVVVVVLVLVVVVVVVGLLVFLFLYWVLFGKHVSFNFVSCNSFSKQPDSITWS